MKILEIKSCRQCYHAQWHGLPDFDTCELTRKEIDYLTIPDWCPLPTAAQSSVEADTRRPCCKDMKTDPLGCDLVCPICGRTIYGNLITKGET